MTLRFHVNHHLVMGFKSAFHKEFIYDVVLNTDWNDLVDCEVDLDTKAETIDKQIGAVSESLEQVRELMI